MATRKTLLLLPAFIIRSVTLRPKSNVLYPYLKTLLLIFHISPLMLQNLKPWVSSLVPIWGKSLMAEVLSRLTAYYPSPSSMHFLKNCLRFNYTIHGRHTLTAKLLISGNLLKILKPRLLTSQWMNPPLLALRLQLLSALIVNPLIIAMELVPILVGGSI